jgi:hypothetical protein
MTNEELERRIAALEEQVANHHAALGEMNKLYGRLYASVTALLNAVDGIRALLPKPKREVM